MTFSEGWIANLKRDWKLRSVMSHGEKKGIGTDTAAALLPKLRKKLSKFAWKDRFNADEGSLNYCMPPDQTVAHKAFLAVTRSRKELKLYFVAIQIARKNTNSCLLGRQPNQDFQKKVGLNLIFTITIIKRNR